MSHLRSVLQFAELDRRKNAGRLVDPAARVDYAKRCLSPLAVEFESARAEWRRRYGVEDTMDRKRIEAALNLAASFENPARLKDLVALRQTIAPGMVEERLWRKTSIAPLIPGHAPLAYETVPKALERLFEWTSSEGFNQLHPVEQATVVQTRLIEISPFEDYSDPVAVIASFSFVTARGYLLPLFRPEDTAEFYRSLSAAFEFQTEGLTVMILAACERSYDLLEGDGC